MPSLEDFCTLTESLIHKLPKSWESPLPLSRIIVFVTGVGQTLSKQRRKLNLNPLRHPFRNCPPELKHIPEPPLLPVSMATPDGVYNILEEATKTKTGIEAICTADAILCLWNWDSADDLRRASAAINHLIKRMEG